MSTYDEAFGPRSPHRTLEELDVLHDQAYYDSAEQREQRLKHSRAEEEAKRPEPRVITFADADEYVAELIRRHREEQNATPSDHPATLTRKRQGQVTMP